MQRKRLPYAAGGLIDEAKMNLSTTMKILMPMVECKQLSPEEKVSLPARAVINLRSAIDTLDEIRALVREEEE